MDKKIIIREKDNQGISVLSTFKMLYSDGSEIESLEDIEKYMDRYREDGVVEIYLTEESIESINFISQNTKLKYVIE